MSAAELGSVLFGVVIGWITYRTLVRRAGAVDLSDIATVIGAVGGGAVLAIFDDDHLFGLYAIGLAVGFFSYLALFFAFNGREATSRVMGDDDRPLRIE
jgi:uncharacterized membrane protein YeaQ/YmgE (transglycosylase-associated protein family)